MKKFSLFILSGALIGISLCAPATAQTPPTQTERQSYSPFFEAVYDGDLISVEKILLGPIDLNARDQAGRNALHIAAFRGHLDILERLVSAGGDINAFENDRYDIITIAAVANDLATLQLALKLGGNPKAITSPYDGTALIAAAHLGHSAVVKTLLAAKAPVDHINNLGWTALIEAVILGDGGANHQEVVKALLEAGADKSITDRQGVSPLNHARQRGYQEIIQLLSQ